MSRLRHSYVGHLRYMQLSSPELFVFVEGKQMDPFFYAGICKSISDLPFRYEICIARQLPGSAGGKQALLKFFVFLRESKALVSSLGGQTTTCIFFLDKDVDDLQRKKKRSQHVVYTEHYDVQNYIFMYGNLLIGAASAASVDPARLRSQLNDAPGWCIRVAELWREWISVCLRVLKDGISCEANFRVVSRVQTRLYGPTDAGLYAILTRDLARRSELPVTVFRRKVAATSRKVARYFSKNQHHRIFKGKWFAVILADEIDQIMAGQPYYSNGLVNRLPCSIASTLNFKEPWADYFRNAINNIVALV